MNANSIFTDCLNRHIVSTPLGPMQAIADDDHLLLLEFETRKDFEGQLKTLHQLDSRPVVEETNPVLRLAQSELDAYFSGTLTEFSVPLRIKGSSFQESVWQGLTAIPYGKTVSYQGLGQRIGAPQAARAIGTANGQNRIAIMIPCHRVVRADGSTGGYAGGTDRKQWLLDHELQIDQKRS